MAEHVMRAYKKHSYMFTNGQYLMRLPGKQIEGQYKIQKVRGTEYWVVFSCPHQNESEVGVIQVEGNRMIYRSSKPMFTGEALYYRKER
jgi:hypothetical protein